MKLAVRGAERPRVAAIEWLDPVYIAGHWTPQLIELAGGEDVLGMTGEPSVTLEWDELAAARPDVAVVMPCGYDAPRARIEALEHAESLASIGAAKVVAVNASAYFSRPGPRLIDGVELLAAILHPTLFGETFGPSRRLSSRRLRSGSRPHELVDRGRRFAGLRGRNRARPPLPRRSPRTLPAPAACARCFVPSCRISAATVPADQAADVPAP